jgi:methyl-accepting chemotaxis protein
VDRFYQRLFEKYPAVRPMFGKTSMAEQKKKLLASLVLVIQNLKNPDRLTGALHQLGQKHVGYGAKPAHYDAVAKTLLEVLKEFAGPAWTTQTKKAWSDALGAVKSIMLEGARKSSTLEVKVKDSLKKSKLGEEKMGKSLKSLKGKTAGSKKGTQNSLADFCKSALDNASAHVLMCDRDLTITYANTTALKKLRELEAEIRRTIPAFSAERVVGSNIDLYHKMPERQRSLLADIRNLPHRADIQIGPLTLNLLVSGILDERSQYVGNIVEWEDVTAKRKMETEMARLKTSLDNTRTNVMVCDRSYTIVYANNASLTTLRRLEADIRKVMSNFSVDRLVGSSIDSYHKNPSHQRRLLDDPKNLPFRTDIKLGPLTLDLNANAIISASGEYLGNVVEWMDVTDQKKAQGEVERLINAASAGRLSERVNSDEFDGFFKVLTGGINKMMDAVVTPLNEAQEVLEAMADGNLTREMTGIYEGEYDNMKNSLNTAIQNLTHTLSLVRNTAENVSSASIQISEGNEDLSQRTSEQAGALEETTSSMEEMTATVKQNADSSRQANQLGLAAREIAEKGGKVTAQAVVAMGEVNKSSKKIADIISVIDEIAFQTNLLALNAAVEAARAGEHGRGFAVVAAEVRNLAQRSATAAKEIKVLINESVQKVTEGSELVNQSGKTLEEIVMSVKKVTDIVAEISTASQEQATGIDQVNKAIMQMDEMTQQNAALVEEAASASQSMKAQAEELTKQVEAFRFKEMEDERKGAGNTASRTAHQAPDSRMNRGEVKTNAGTRNKTVTHSATGAASQKMESGNGQKEKRPAVFGKPVNRTTAAGVKAADGGEEKKNGHRTNLKEFDEF